MSDAKDKPKFWMNPENPNQIWDGTGEMPLWLKKYWLKEHCMCYSDPRKQQHK